MKNVLAALLLLAFVVSSIPSAFGQRSRSFDKRFVRDGVERTQFSSISAVGDDRGVLISWETKVEPGSMGFYVYRVEHGVPTLVSKTMTLGAAVSAGGDERTGGSYQVFDPNGNSNSSYLIENYSLNGRRFFSKPVSTEFVKNIEEYTDVDVEDVRAASLSEGSVVESSELVLSEELEAAVTSSLQTPDLNNHRWVVSQPGAAISVKQDGFYRVPSSMLQAASFPVNSNSANWRLFLDGVEQSISVGPGDQYIEFYGRGVETAEADARVYYLISGATAGKRIPNRTIRPLGGNVLSQSFSSRSAKFERTIYFNKVLNGDGENFFGRVISTTSTGVPFSLPGVDFSSLTATVTVKLQGFTNVPHQVQASLNGNPLGIITGSAYNNFSSTFQVPIGQLVSGNNTLSLNSVGGGDFSLFDSVTVEYKRQYFADQNRIHFSTPGYRRVDVDGFTTANVRVFDITSDGQPQRINNATVIQNGGTFTAKLPASRAGVYYALEDSAVLTPSAVIMNNPSTLSALSNAADLVIISHSAPDFMTQAENWANYRRGQGFTVKVVDIKDVYDEFNYGISSALSIRSFLDYASQNWATPPQYVLLIGDASYDPKGYEGFGTWNLVPSRMVVTPYGETASDEALADFNNDGLAELSIGRIPARTSTQIATVLGKTMAFEVPAMQSFDRGSLFAYDEPKGYNFEAMSQSIRSKLPQSMPSTMVDRLATGSSTLLLSELNTGKFIVNYAGHGASGVWHNSGFFGLTQAQTITNTPTIFTMLTCFNGYFVRTNADSLGERLLHSTVGGSVASWASTSETTPDVQEVMATRFYEQLALGNITRIGDLIRDAKQVVPASSDVRFSWVLLGDPMLKTR